MNRFCEKHYLQNLTTFLLVLPSLTIAHRAPVTSIKESNQDSKIAILNLRIFSRFNA